MCGIHGIYRFDGLSVAPCMLASMGDRIRHRVPDDKGSHVDGSCGIGMCRLSVSIMDLAGGQQPPSNADGSLWLVCNGEVYNFCELRGELQGKGYYFKSGYDSEVLLHLYDAETQLPDDILDRKKRGFDTPMGAWLKRELAPVLTRLLVAAVVQARGLFNPAVVKLLMADHEVKLNDGTDMLLAMMNLEIWSRIFLDRRDPAAVADEIKSCVV